MELSRQAVMDADMRQVMLWYCEIDRDMPQEAINAIFDRLHYHRNGKRPPGLYSERRLPKSADSPPSQ